MSRRAVRKELLTRWFAQSDAQQLFLRRAREIDKTLPHSEGLSRLLPVMNWREIGSHCGLSESISDEVAYKLSAKRSILIVNADKHSFGLLAGYLVDEVDAVRRDRRRMGIEIVAFVLGLLLALRYITWPWHGLKK